MFREYGEDFRAWKAFADVAAAKAFTQFVPGQKVLIGGEEGQVYIVQKSASTGNDITVIAPTYQTDLRLVAMGGTELIEVPVAPGEWDDSSENITLVRSGRVVTLYLQDISPANSTPQNTIATVPAGLRPRYLVSGVGIIDNDNGRTVQIFISDSTGEIRANNAASTFSSGEVLECTITYVI